MDGLLSPIFLEPVKHILKLILRPSYAAYHWQVTKLSRVPRYNKYSTTVARWRIDLIDSASFLSAYRSIFFEQVLNFPSLRPSPLILDCGANIGLSVLYFKLQFPKARIIAFEPDPMIFEVLKQNLARNNVSDVVLVNKAVWDEDTVVKFAMGKADTGRITVANDTHDVIDVSTVRLRNYLDAPVDFLKMDIEGAEARVIKDCSDRLINVDRLFVEYHSFDNEAQRLSEFMSILEQASFRLHIHSDVGLSTSPFVQRSLKCGMDLQLNIFAFRE